jgi:ABC-type enterochelin transport system ATPase subunit
MLILKAGKVVAQDNLPKLLNNTVLSEVFEIPVHISEKKGHYYSSVL